MFVNKFWLIRVREEKDKTKKNKKNNLGLLESEKKKTKKKITTNFGLLELEKRRQK